MYPASEASAAISAASSSLGSWVRTQIAVARSIASSCANALSGHAVMTRSAAGNRSTVAKRERGSMTKLRHSITVATAVSCAAKSTAPTMIRRGGGADHVDEQHRALALVQLAALGPQGTVGERERRLVQLGAPERPLGVGVGADEQLGARPRDSLEGGHERRAPARARELR